VGADPCVQKHFDLNIIATALGAPNAKQTYPGDRYVASYTSRAPRRTATLPFASTVATLIPPFLSQSCVSCSVTSSHWPWSRGNTGLVLYEYVEAEARWNRNDLIWIMQSGAIVDKRSMHCPGIDDERKDEGDPDLEVEQPQPQSQSQSQPQSWVGVVPSWLGLLGRVGAVWRAQTRELHGGSES
jgi:hypothetical protein